MSALFERIRALAFGGAPHVSTVTQSRGGAVTAKLDVELLRASFDLVVTREPELTHRFYEILFERHPQVKPLFRPARRKEQERMLAEALGAVVDHLEDAAWLSGTLEALGQKHVDYGVRDEMYAWVGEALLCTLAEIAGKQWSPQLERAWAGAYEAIAAMMRAGAAKVARG